MSKTLNQILEYSEFHTNPAWREAGFGPTKVVTAADNLRSTETPVETTDTDGPANIDWANHDPIVIKLLDLLGEFMLQDYPMDQNSFDNPIHDRAYRLADVHEGVKTGFPVVHESELGFIEQHSPTLFRAVKFGNEAHNRKFGVPKVHQGATYHGNLQNAEDTLRGFDTRDFMVTPFNESLYEDDFAPGTKVVMPLDNRQHGDSPSATVTRNRLDSDRYDQSEVVTADGRKKFVDDDEVQPLTTEEVIVEYLNETFKQLQETVMYNVGRLYESVVSFRGMQKTMTIFMPTLKVASRRQIQEQLNKVLPGAIILTMHPTKDQGRISDTPAIILENATYLIQENVVINTAIDTVIIFEAFRPFTFGDEAALMAAKKEREKPPVEAQGPNPNANPGKEDNFSQPYAPEKNVKGAGEFKFRRLEDADNDNQSGKLSSKVNEAFIRVKAKLLENIDDMDHEKIWANNPLYMAWQADNPTGNFGTFNSWMGQREEHRNLGPNLQKFFKEQQ